MRRVRPMVLALVAAARFAHGGAAYAQTADASSPVAAPPASSVEPIPAQRPEDSSAPTNGTPTDRPVIPATDHPLTAHVTHFTPELGFGCGQIGDSTCGLAARLAFTWRLADLHATALFADGTMGGFGFSVGMPYVKLGAGLALSVRLGVDLEGGYSVTDVQTSGVASPGFVNALYTAARGGSLESLAWADRVCATAVAGNAFAASGTCTARAIFAGGRAFLAAPLAYALGQSLALELRPEGGADAGGQFFTDNVSSHASARLHVGFYGAIYVGVHL